MYASHKAPAPHGQRGANRQRLHAVSTTRKTTCLNANRHCRRVGPGQESTQANGTTLLKTKPNGAAALTSDVLSTTSAEASTETSAEANAPRSEMEPATATATQPGDQQDNSSNCQPAYNNPSQPSQSNLVPPTTSLQQFNRNRATEPTTQSSIPTRRRRQWQQQRQRRLGPATIRTTATAANPRTTSPASPASPI